MFAGVGILLLVGVLGTTTMSASTEFVTPTELSNGGHANDWVNLEGVVTDLETAGGRTTFAVTDGNASVRVSYDKPLPETLQEGRVVIAKGRYDGGTLTAEKLSVRAHEGSDNES